MFVSERVCGLCEFCVFIASLARCKKQLKSCPLLQCACDRLRWVFLWLWLCMWLIGLWCLVHCCCHIRLWVTPLFNMLDHITCVLHLIWFCLFGTKVWFEATCIFVPNSMPLFWSDTIFDSSTCDNQQPSGQKFGPQANLFDSSQAPKRFWNTENMCATQACWSKCAILCWNCDFGNFVSRFSIPFHSATSGQKGITPTRHQECLLVAIPITTNQWFCRNWCENDPVTSQISVAAKPWTTHIIASINKRNWLQNSQVWHIAKTFIRDQISNNTTQSDTFLFPQPQRAVCWNFVVADCMLPNVCCRITTRVCFLLCW
jgi:hypothetical protein